MPLYETFPQRSRHLLRQQRFAGAWLPLDQKGSLQRHRRIDGHTEIIGGYVGVGSGKFHAFFLNQCVALVNVCRARTKWPSKPAVAVTGAGGKSNSKTLYYL